MSKSIMSKAIMRKSIMSKAITSKAISRNFVSRFLLAASIVLLLAAASSGAPAHSTLRSASPATAPAIQITPNHGPIHTPVVITGQGFGAHEQVGFLWGTHPFFAAQTDANGNFVGGSHPVQWYAAYPGVIKATGRTSGKSATTTFTVTN
jgi:hypothetical protein